MIIYLMNIWYIDILWNVYDAIWYQIVFLIKNLSNVLSKQVKLFKFFTKFIKFFRKNKKNFKNFLKIFLTKNAYFCEHPEGRLGVFEKTKKFFKKKWKFFEKSVDMLFSIVVEYECWHQKRLLIQSSAKVLWQLHILKIKVKYYYEFKLLKFISFYV